MSIVIRSIETITAEIKIFEQSMKESIAHHAWEIGRRLNEAKSVVSHGEFTKWIENNFEFTNRYAQEFMKFYDSNTNSNSLFDGLEWTKIRQVISLPESVDRAEFIADPHTIPSTGESKQVEDMTVKQLREVTKQLKQAESERIRLENLTITQQRELNEERSKPPTIDTESLKRIAKLEAKEDKEYQLAKDNIKLQLDMKNMERDFAEKITQRDKESQAYGDLRKSLRSIINVVTMENSNAKQQYRLIAGHKEANEAVQDFIKRFDPLVQELFKTWRGVTVVSEEVIVNVAGTTDSGVVEIAGGEGQDHINPK
jgi:hypothetical protein